MTTRSKDRRRTRGTAVSAIVSVACVTVACSAKHDPAGGILLAVDTNLKVPDDIDGIGVSVTSADGSKVTTDLKFALAPAGDAKFPATLAIVHGTSDPIDIRAVGYKGDTAIALRDAVTQLPADHTAVLHLELNWLDAPLVTGTMTEAVHQVASTCPTMQTPIGGSCSSFLLDSATLPDFAAIDVAPSDSSAAVSVATCFSGAAAVTPDASSCTFTAPAGVTDATQINVGLRPASGAVGWCEGGSCVVPLPNDAAEGWSLGVDGLVHLPKAACGNAAVAAVVVSPVTASCPVISPAHPVAQVYGTAGADGGGGEGDSGPGMTLADGGHVIGDGGPDATMTSSDGGDGGPDASRVDAGPPPSPVFLKHPGVLSIATDATHLFVLSNEGNTLEVFSSAFKPGDVTTALMVNIGTTGRPESAAAYPFFGTINSANQVTVVNVNDPTTVDNVDSTPADSVDPALADLGNGTFELGWVPGFGAAEVAFASNSLPAYATNQIFDTDAYALGIDPGCPAAAPCFATSGENDNSQYYLAYGSLGTLATNLDRTATQFAFPYPGGHFAWSDTSGAIYFFSGTTWSMVEPAGTMVTTRRALAATSGRLFWIGGTSNSLFTTTLDAQAEVGPTKPVVETADGGVASGVQQVIVQGTDVFWFDGVGIYRQDATVLP